MGWEFRMQSSPNFWGTPSPLSDGHLLTYPKPQLTPYFPCQHSGGTHKLPVKKVRCIFHCQQSVAPSGIPAIPQAPSAYLAAVWETTSFCMGSSISEQHFALTNTFCITNVWWQQKICPKPMLEPYGKRGKEPHSVKFKVKLGPADISKSFSMIYSEDFSEPFLGSATNKSRDEHMCYGIPAQDASRYKQTIHNKFNLLGFPRSVSEQKVCSLPLIDWRLCLETGVLGRIFQVILIIAVEMGGSVWRATFSSVNHFLMVYNWNTE